MGWTQNGLLSKWLSPLVTLTSRRGKQYWNMISSFVSGLWRQWMWKRIKFPQNNKSASTALNSQDCIELQETVLAHAKILVYSFWNLILVIVCKYYWKHNMTKLCRRSRWQSLAPNNLQQCKLHSEILLKVLLRGKWYLW